MKFLELVKQSPLPAMVKEVHEKETELNPETNEFKIIYGELAEELQEGFEAMQSIFLEYWKEFRDFAKRTDENFQLLFKTYGEISNKLTTILETLVKESRETREMLNENMKLLREAIEKLSI